MTCLTNIQPALYTHLVLIFLTSGGTWKNLGKAKAAYCCRDFFFWFRGPSLIIIVIAIKVILDRAVAETLAFEVVFVARQTQLFRRSQKRRIPNRSEGAEPSKLPSAIEIQRWRGAVQSVAKPSRTQFPHLLETSCVRISMTTL